MEEKRTIRTHRVGTVTFGLILVVMGALFLLRMIFPALDYELIFRLWPLIFISLGIEVLASSRRAEEKLVYDGAAISPDSACPVCHGNGGYGSGLHPCGRNAYIILGSRDRERMSRRRCTGAIFRNMFL